MAWYRKGLSWMLYLWLFITGAMIKYVLKVVDWVTRWVPGWRRGRRYLAERIELGMRRWIPSCHRLLFTMDFIPFCGNGEIKKTYPLESVTFSGCSWLMVFHIGAARWMVENGWIDLETIRVFGCSSGALVGAAVLCQIPEKEFLEFVDLMAMESQRKVFGPLARMSWIVKAGLERLLPEDAHLFLSNRLFVSVTVYPSDDGKLLGNRVVSNFDSREDLIQTLLASCYIPFYYEKPVRIGGSFFLDDGITNNCPCGPGTITISPYARSADVSPASNGIDAVHRLFPPSPIQLSAYRDLGYETARRVLQG